MPHAVASRTQPEECAPVIELPSGVMRFHFMAWLPQGIVGPKVATFIADQDARVVHVEPDVLRVRIGRTTWRRRAADEGFPLEVTLSLNHETACARSATHLVIEMRPLVSNLPVDLLDQRFRGVARSLRYCLLAEELTAV